MKKKWSHKVACILCYETLSKGISKYSSIDVDTHYGSLCKTIKPLTQY